MIFTLFAFAAGQFATLGIWPLAAVLGWVTLIGLWRHFKQLERLQRETPPESPQEAPGDDPDDHPARRYAGHNGGRRTADKT